MKSPVIKQLSLLLVFVFPIFFAFAPVSAEPVEESARPDVYLDEISFGTGYAWGSVKDWPDDMSVYPAFVRFGFNANGLFGIQGNRSTLQFTLEPFVNAVSGREDGIEAGCGLGVRYLHQVARPLDLYLEASAAPMFYSIDTIELGSAGFNFLDQFGAGLRYRFARDKAFFAGYRWRHISNAGLVDRSNDGINTDALVVGLSLLY